MQAGTAWIIAMRTHGTLSKWNDDRGFGFIAPAQGEQEIFVHISAFPRDGARPRLNELISFEVETGPDGKLRAVRIMRPGQRPASARPPAKRKPDSPSLGVGAVVALLAFVGLGVYGYSHVAPTPPEPASAQAPRLSAAPTTFACDGRTMCSQMSSCAEARYFLQHCPGTKMDGDHDGVPCEQQWCN